MNHSTSKGLGIHCHDHGHTMRFYVKTLFAVLFLVLAIQFNGQAQGARPSCNISGPLEAVAGGPDILINVEVAHSTANPTISYAFTSNSAKAVVRKQGPVVYNAAKNTATQQLTVSPGIQGSEFNLKITVTTANGVSACSQSVSVSQ
ncbi:MAG: hypothetical protein JWO06_3336 [Bacteroidota bacterium]|nr:hypothetical protein [Bacteroidota bacterium]